MSPLRAKDGARPPAFVYRKANKDILSPTADSILCCDDVPLTKLAEEFGTPLYVYSASTIERRMREFDAAFGKTPHTVCYSVKANSNLAILRLVARLKCGFDVVSGGELGRVLKVSRQTARKVVFSGVGKTKEEMAAALNADILLFNVESESELSALAACAARLKKKARVALRVNPDVSAKTHPYISTGLHKHKFGIPIDEARALYARAASARHLQVAGVSVHIGSQITDVGPFGEALERVAELVRILQSDGHQIKYVDAGGGLGIDYMNQTLPEFSDYAAAYARAVALPLRGLGVHLLLEPGRSIVGPAGAMLTSVLYRKTNNSKSFLIVDAAMNDLVRPALYGANHEIVPVIRRASRPTEQETIDVVGPICETGDFLARDRSMPVVHEGDLLAVLDTGAYGMALASNYNTRLRPAEVLVDGEEVKLVRKRETFRDLIRNET
jgi:diaminopimelate decarboxylase